MTVIAPFVLTRADAAALLATLKHRCGSGGTITTTDLPDGSPALALELQGDHVARAAALLRELGYTKTAAAI